MVLGHQATIAHDHIYGLLGLLKDVDRSRICINYEMPVELLFRDVTYQMIHQSKSVKSFASIEGISQPRFALPSWVRDWSMAQEGKGRLLAQWELYNSFEGRDAIFPLTPELSTRDPCEKKYAPSASPSMKKSGLI